MNEEHIWYIAPSGCVATNRILAEHLPAENECKDKLCEDGEERDLWKCDHAMVAELQRAKASLNLTFKVFVQEGQHGKVRLWVFPKKTVPVRKPAIASR